MTVCLALARAIGQSRTIEQVYDVALDALASGLGVARSAVLLFDADGVMRFKAHRRISETYRRAVEGHSPWTPDTRNPATLVVGDVTGDPSLRGYLPAFAAENIAALAFIPLVNQDRVIGKFMLYFDVPHTLDEGELRLAAVIASQVAFAVEQHRAEDLASRSEERLRFALEAASMGTWDWDLARGTVRWSEGFERAHGLPAGTLDRTFASYERVVHDDDRESLTAALHQAIAQHTPCDVEYRIVAPGGSIQWVESKGRVEYVDGLPVRMTGVCIMATRRKEAELARLADAEEASRLKDEFLATLSHELRSPLNAIVGWVQMLQIDTQLPDRVRGAVDVIVRNARLQARLIEDIVDVSRIISGRLEIERVPVALPQLVDTVVSDSRLGAGAKRIAVTTAVDGDVREVIGDPKRLHQVLSNLLSNAVKFTPEGGRVRVECADEGESIRIVIQDSGVGIEPEFLPYMFDRFRQADRGPTRRHGGLGLGLAIARHLVEQHGGSIRADSPGPGRGTVMTICLPPAPRGASRAGADERPRPGRPDGLLKQVSVVVVDDHYDSREMLATLFERTGARVFRCESAEDALATLRARDIALMVADLAMPDVDGYELIRRVRVSYPGLPAVAVSACARSEDRGRALSCGYSAYCAKPIEQTQLLQTVWNVMRR
jgi:signal transduction histidine kinase